MVPDEVQATLIIENQVLPDHSGSTDSTSEIILYFVRYGGSYGIINWDPRGNLTDWDIVKSVTPLPPLPPIPILIVVYSYTPGDYPVLDGLVTDYAFGNDYLTRPLYDSGLPSEASYGIYPTIVNLQVGKSYLTNNKTKVDASIGVFSGYID
jgi:hypothetical protein